MSGEQQGDRERWNARYQAQATIPEGPPEALRRMAQHLPDTGVAVDLAGGTGSALRWLADRGLTPVLVEVSHVALSLAAARFADHQQPLRTVEHDLVGATLGQVLALLSDGGLSDGGLSDGGLSDGGVSHGGSAVSLVTCFHYLQRDLLGSVGAGLPDGAVFACAIATTTNLERNPRPSARFLLQPGELRDLVCGGVDGAGLQVLHEHEGWNEGGRHEAELVVRQGR